MRYRVNGGSVIRSENAAKPEAQKSKYVVDLLQSFDPVEHTLDYGAGKLRYLDELLGITDRLTVTDSTVQLEREQKIKGRKQAIKEFCSSSNSIEAVDLRKISSLENEFDRAFLFNVLQIIPIPSVRRSVLRRIFKSLKPGGELIASVQYRNSDFTRMSSMENAQAFRDGFLIDHIRGTSFYALIQPDVLRSSIVGEGYDIAHSQLNDGSCFVFAKKPSIQIALVS